MSDFDHEKFQIENALAELRQMKWSSSLDKPRQENGLYQDIGRAIVEILNDGHFVHVVPFWSGLKSPKRLEHSYGHYDFRCPECGGREGIK